MQKVKQALFDGGIARANKPDDVRNTPGIQRWQDLVSDLSQCWGIIPETNASCCAPKCIACGNEPERAVKLVDRAAFKQIGLIVHRRRSYMPGSTWQTTGSSWSIMSLRYVACLPILDSWRRTL